MVFLLRRFAVAVLLRLADRLSSRDGLLQDAIECRAEQIERRALARLAKDLGLRPRGRAGDWPRGIDRAYLSERLPLEIIRRERVPSAADLEDWFG